MNNTVEILSPAGDMERFEFALKYGCDAVYLAGKIFGMRAGAPNFSSDELICAVKKAHSYGVKVYVTCNTLVRNRDLDKLPEFVTFLGGIGVDAVIVTDIGVMQIVKKCAPAIDIHISTQAGVVNYQTAREFWNMGAKRIVLARELALDEIAEIRAKTDPKLEIEAFVHGAMCMSFSGRCLISNYLTNRDANNGECCQPCRWKYYVTEETRSNEFFPIVQDDEGTYLFNSRDMCMIEHIPELVEAGVTSFKIEGRAKSAYYVAVVTNAYKKALSDYLSLGDTERKKYKPKQWILDEVDKISHREYSTGFFFGNEPGQVTDNGGYVRNYDVMAISQGNARKHLLKLLQRNKFNVGDIIEVLPFNEPPFEIKVESLFDRDMLPISTANKAAQTIYLKTAHDNIEKGVLLRKKR